MPSSKLRKSKNWQGGKYGYVSVEHGHVLEEVAEYWANVWEDMGGPQQRLLERAVDGVSLQNHDMLLMHGYYYE
jgi:hypothetical protein